MGLISPPASERTRRSRALPEMQRHEKGAKGGSGKLATQSRPYRRKVVADRGWQLGQHAGLTLPKEEGQHAVLTLPLNLCTFAPLHRP